nr:hypothetical protein [Tanacetum cinerariifolium]
MNDDSIPIGIENSVFNMEEDILYFKRLLKSKVCSNSLFDNDEINSNKLESHVESNFVESPSNHDTVKFDHLEEFSGPLIPIHIVKEERIRREQAEYISRMEMLFTINPRPHPTVNANMNVESIPSSLIPVQDNESQWEEIDIVNNTDVLPPGFDADDSEGEIDAVEELHAEFDVETDFDAEISVVRNTVDELKCLDPRDEFDDDDYFSFMFRYLFQSVYFSTLR